VTDICIIGAGNIGGALAIALNRAGFDISQLVTNTRPVPVRIRREINTDSQVTKWKRLTHIDASVVFITTPDPLIENVSDSIAPLVRKGQYVFHTSGSLSSTVLKSVAERGGIIGSIHPLTSISDPVRGASQFDGAYFCIEGMPKAVKLGKKIARQLGGQSFSISTESKPLYHAAAVTAAGHVTALFDVAVEMLTKCGLGGEESRKIFFPLTESAVQNLRHQKAEDALTGTFARLDIDTFERHLTSMHQSLAPEIVDIYLDLGKRSVELVERRSGVNERTRAFRERIDSERRKTSGQKC